MVEKRQVTGQSQGEFLAHLLNQKVDKRDRRMPLFQQELEELCTGMTALAEKLPATNFDADWPQEIKKLVARLNGFLETCAEYPQVFLARSPGMPPRLVQEFAPVTPSGTVRHNAISATCALVRYGLLDRVRRCHRCGRWFFAKKSDSKYCSRGCQTKPSEENKRRKREYAKRYYRENKEREQRAKL